MYTINWRGIRALTTELVAKAALRVGNIRSRGGEALNQCSPLLLLSFETFCFTVQMTRPLSLLVVESRQGELPHATNSEARQTSKEASRFLLGCN